MMLAVITPAFPTVPHIYTERQFRDGMGRERILTGSPNHQDESNEPALVLYGLNSCSLTGSQKF